MIMAFFAPEDRACHKWGSSIDPINVNEKIATCGFVESSTKSATFGASAATLLVAFAKFFAESATFRASVATP